jgi:hypothetical protein
VKNYQNFANITFKCTKPLVINDDAPKVKLRANRLLAWLGHGLVASSKDLAEFASFFTLKEKTSGASRTLVPNFNSEERTVQRERCSALLKKFTFADFAAAFNCTPLEVIELLDWQRNDHFIEIDVCALALQTATNEVLYAIVDRLPDIHILNRIMYELPLGQRSSKIMLQSLESGGNFSSIFQWAGPICELDDPLESLAGKHLMKELLESQVGVEKRQQQIDKELTVEEQEKAHKDAIALDTKLHHIKEELYAIGMLVSRTGAKHTLDKFTQYGFDHIAPNWLDSLRFNAALEDRKLALEPKESK